MPLQVFGETLEPRVSVLMLAYNHERFIAEAIESVLAQKTDFAFELVIGEDHSSDHTLEVVERYAVAYPNVKIVTDDRNVGMGENFRRLVRKARGPFLAFCEGDDYWQDAEKLKKQITAIEGVSRASFVYADFNRAAEHDGNWYIFANTIRSRGAKLPSGLIFEDLLDRIDIHLSTVLCRRDLARQYVDSAYFAPELRLADVPLFLYLAAHGEVSALPDSVSTYRHHPESATNRSLQARMNIVRDHVAVVERFQQAFGSLPERQEKRRPILDAIIASAAYAAGDAAVFRRHSDSRFWKNHLRLLLMRWPLLHSAYMRSVKRTQARDYLRNARRVGAEGTSPA